VSLSMHESSPGKKLSRRLAMGTCMFTYRSRKEKRRLYQPYFFVYIDVERDITKRASFVVDVRGTGLYHGFARWTPDTNPT